MSVIQAPLAPVSTTNTTNIFLNTAENIGKKLLRDALWSPDGKCNWQGASLEGIRGHYQLSERTFKSDLYKGLSGIALFLSELYASTQNPIYLKVLEGSMKTIIHQQKHKPLLSLFSFFSGQLGVAYSLWRIGNKLNREDWRKEGLRILSTLKGQKPQEQEIDIIGGAAGTIPVLLGIFQQEQDSYLLDTAIQCGDFLLEKAHKGRTSWFWDSIGAQKGLTGYSHGAAGIANALLDLFLVTGEERFREAAMKSYQFEREHYQPQLKNWPDLRANNGRVTCGEAWCHGAPGLVLARLKAYQQTNDPSFFEEAKVALETTYRSVSRELQNPSRSNFSLCHGLLGNADILLSAGRLLAQQDYIYLAEEVGQLGIQLYDNTATDWPSGINDPSGETTGMAYTPGLMLGAAGTGYFYLRLQNRSISSMLLL